MKIPVAVIGAGNMGEAIIASVCKSYKVNVCEADKTKADAIANKYDVTVGDVNEVISKSEIVLIAVKPQVFEQVLSDIKDFITDGHLVVSIAAGVTTKYIEERLGGGVKVIRTMPNLPAQISKGVTAIAGGANTNDDDLHKASVLLKFVGETLIVDESIMDDVTAVSGSGPAYLFLFVEEYIKAAQALDLTDSEAKALVMQTLRGSLELLEKSGEDASTLRERVTSKGGTTAAALEEFSKGNISQIFTDALAAAKRRAGELAQ